MTHIKYNLSVLKLRLENHHDREYMWKEMAAGSGVHVNTLSNIAHNRTRRVDLANLAALLDYFAAEGMPVTIADLFTVSDE